MHSWRDTFKQAQGTLLLGAVFALVLLALSGVLSYRNARNLIARSSRVNEIHATITHEKDLLSRLNQAEGAMFSYVITGDTNFLAPYHPATNGIPTELRYIKSGIEGHADAQKEFTRLEKQIYARLGQISQRIELRAKEGGEAVAALIKTGQAKAVMDEIRDANAALVRHETERLAQMEERSMFAARATLVVDVISGTFSVVLLAVIFAWLMRENVTRRGTEEELRKAGRDLEMRVAQRTADLATLNGSLQREIAEHKAAEEALRASEKKNEQAATALAEKNKDLEMLIYVASHDLRAPLLNIRGFVSELLRSCSAVQTLVERTPGDSVSKTELARALEDVPESASFIQAGVARMDALLSGFLRLSRLGRAALRISRIDMNALLQNLAQSFAFQLREAGGDIDIGKLPRCSGDATQLTQVFSNIIDNAVKYRDPSRPLAVRVSAITNDGMVAYQISDNGIGIPEDHLQRVFEIFHRVNQSSNEGEGLGLTIARRILDRQGGRMTVESAVGAGSIFTVYMPAAEREAGGAA